MGNTNEKKAALGAAICYSILSLLAIISVARAFSALSLISTIVIVALTVTLFLKNKLFFAVAAGANIALNVYYLTVYFSFANFLYLISYIAILLFAVLAIKKNQIVAKIWFLAAVLLLVGSLVGWIQSKAFSYLEYTWMAILFGLVEIAALLCAGRWLKNAVAATADAPAQNNSDQSFNQNNAPFASDESAKDNSNQSFNQNNAPQLRFNEEVSAKAKFDYEAKLNEFLATGAEINEETEAKLFAQAVELQMLKAPASAQFCSLEQMTIRQNANGSYTVSGFVDSQNSYGAMVRTPFSLNVYKADEWKSVDIFVSSVSISQLGGKGGGLFGFGIFLTLVSAALDIVSIMMMGEYEIFHGILVASSITFFVGIVMIMLGRAAKR